MKRLLLCLGIFLSVAVSSRAQLNQNNMEQIAAIAAGNDTINKAVKSQTKMLQKMALSQGAMVGEFVKIESWEHKYNSYLKTTRGYAESLKAGTMLYADGVRLFQSIMDLKKAVEANPQGVAAAGLMSNIYPDVFAELVKTYTRLKEVAKGGKENMLNGAERNELLWSLVEDMEALNRKLHSLAISIAFYNLGDVWRTAIAGFVQKDHGLIAREAMDRWKRARRVSQILNQ